MEDNSWSIVVSVDALTFFFFLLKPNWTENNKKILEYANIISTRN